MRSHLIHPVMLAVPVALIALLAGPDAAEAGHRDRHQRNHYRGHHGGHGHIEGHYYDRDSGFGISVSIGDRPGVHVYHRPAPRPDCRYIPPHCEERAERVCVQPARTVRHWVPARYETVCDRWGRSRCVLVEPGHWHHHTIPARYETRIVQVQVPGRWVCVDGCDGHHHHDY